MTEEKAREAPRAEMAALEGWVGRIQKGLLSREPQTGEPP